MSKKSPEEGLYSRVTRRIWLSRDFNELSAPKPNAQTLFFRLLTGPELGVIPGLFRTSRAGLAESLGWPIQTLERCFKEITERKMAAHDRARGLMWVPKAINHNVPDNSNIVVGWRSAWKELPDCPLRDEARTYLGEWFYLKGYDWGNAWAEVTGYVRGNVPPNPKGNKEQEQEQEQDVPPSPPADPELQAKARRWLDLATAANGQGRGEANDRFGDPARWPETLAVCEVMREVYGRPDAPRHSGDPRAPLLAERFAEGFVPVDLGDAIRGSKNDTHIAENRQFQTLKTILRDAAQVDKFRALYVPPASQPKVKTYGDIEREEREREARRAQA